LPAFLPAVQPAAAAGLPLAELESTYDALAEAIDRAPEGHSELMLVKLALLLAQEVGDGARVAELIELALRDL
jgi:integrase